MSSDLAEHLPLTRERHAAVVVELCRRNARVWSALFRPERYVYDERDQERGYELDLRCSGLRIGFERTTDWPTIVCNLRELVRLDERRRRMSIGVWIGDRILYGEPL